MKILVCVWFYAFFSTLQFTYVCKITCKINSCKNIGDIPVKVQCYAHKIVLWSHNEKSGIGDDHYNQKNKWQKRQRQTMRNDVGQFKKVAQRNIIDTVDSECQGLKSADSDGRLSFGKAQRLIMAKLLLKKKIINFVQSRNISEL